MLQKVPLGTKYCSSLLNVATTTSTITTTFSETSTTTFTTPSTITSTTSTIELLTILSGTSTSTAPTVTDEVITTIVEPIYSCPAELQARNALPEYPPALVGCGTPPLGVKGYSCPKISLACSCLGLPPIATATSISSTTTTLTESRTVAKITTKTKTLTNVDYITVSRQSPSPLDPPSYYIQNSSTVKVEKSMLTQILPTHSSP
ncbi:hypothetical protein BS50DRAFT_675861 [Corynespora cassiicola Philippines]|uniref:Uncharacterized protein n=1 Tax=Corynespora cassiicola Philippines TaxID=1448308 RepID=A0A2T2NQZ7_CORCC|nr:hypothetical protein BS50DRAFT_675861 [Corynespora cassiicola Philippines]